MTNELGQAIRAARERRSMSQDELAAAVGTSGRTVGNWERGATSPRAAMARIEDVLGPLAPVADAGLQAYRDDELLAELGRRLQSVRATEVPPVEDELADRRRVQGPPLDAAADSRENRGAQLREELDVVGEESQDTDDHSR